MPEQTKDRRLHLIASNDATFVAKRDKEYGSSWRRRGGWQAFAVIWRKVDRIEALLKQQNSGYDIFKAWEDNPGDIRDDIRDLRQYLLLLEEHCVPGDIVNLENPPEQANYSMPRPPARTMSCPTCDLDSRAGCPECDGVGWVPVG